MAHHASISKLFSCFFILLLSTAVLADYCPTAQSQICGVGGVEHKNQSCGTRGHIFSNSYFNAVGPCTTHSFVECRNLCLSDEHCHAFRWKNSGDECVLIRRSVGFKVRNDDTSPYQFFERGCFIFRKDEACTAASTDPKLFYTLTVAANDNFGSFIGIKDVNDHPTATIAQNFGDNVGKFTFDHHALVENKTGTVAYTLAGSSVGNYAPALFGTAEEAGPLALECSLQHNEFLRCTSNQNDAFGRCKDNTIVMYPRVEYPNGPPHCHHVNIRAIHPRRQRRR